MSAILDFIGAAFGACQDPVHLICDDLEGDCATSQDIDAFQAQGAGAPIYLSAKTQGGVAPFVYGVMEGAEPDQWQDLTVRPTASLYRDGVLINVWSLEQPVYCEEAALVLSQMGGDLGEPIPTPGANGWELVQCDPEVYAAFDALRAVYADEPPVPGPAAEPPPWEEADYGALLDARILTPIDFDDPIYQQEMVISVGANRNSKNWRGDHMTVGKFVGLLSRHPEDKRKDGPGFVLAEILGPQRIKTAVKSIYAVGLDIDVGVPSADIDRALADLGVTAVRYSTHSHLKSTTKFVKDAILKKMKVTSLDTEVVRAYLRQEKRWVETMIASVEYTGDEHEAEGLMAVLAHDPMPKCRVIVPLAEPFCPATVAGSHAEGMAMWNKVPPALSRLLGLELAFDRSAVDPSRLFYFPRHAPGRPYETTLFGGPLLDWRALDLENKSQDPFEAALEAEVNAKGSGKSRSSTPEGRGLGRWSVKAAHGFQIVDVLRDHCDDRIRTHGANKVDIECPFDEEHSNPGDPEDRGCFAVNAGDGPSEIFTIKCQHDSCTERTNLDMLGKMLKDGWFGEDVLEDDGYNAATPEESAQPEASVKIAEEDDARTEYARLIEALDEHSPDEQVDEAVTALIAANLTKLAQSRWEGKIKSALKINQATLTQMMRLASRDLNTQRNKSGEYKDPKNRMVFSYEGTFNFDEACDMCYTALLETNRRDTEPTFSCVQDKPVRLSRNPKSGRIAFDELTNRALWAELNKRVTFVRRNDGGDGAREPVDKVVADHIYEQAWTELPQSPEVIYTPMFTAEGDLVVAPGYKPELNMIMAETGFEVDVPVAPSWDEVEDAVNLLRNDLLYDFPFLDHDLEGIERRAPSEANALAMLITPFMRRMINGCTPVFFIAKPTPGTGGTLLGKVPMLLFDGAEGAPMRYTQNEEEMQKALLAAIIESRSHLFFDDVKDFNNRSLLQSITAQEIGGRLLGVSRNVSRPNTFNWVATGNNPIVGSEMERRIVWVRINAKTADIQQRTYKHDLPSWIPENRSRLVGAILTMIQYWIDLGCPPFEARKRASFEDWSRKVGGVLQACGVEGFLDNRRSAGADMEETAIRAFVKEWFRKFGFEKTLPAKLFEHATSMELDIIEGNNDDQKKQRFPKRLHTLDGRVFAIDGVDYMVVTAFDDDQNLSYALEPLAKVSADAEAQYEAA